MAKPDAGPARTGAYNRPMSRLAGWVPSADFVYLADRVKAVEGHADSIDIDIMDAHLQPTASGRGN
jgi:hypothetical protein